MATVTAERRRPFHLIAKPSGAACNLACEYCFFLSKSQLYPGSTQRMDDEVLQAYIQGILETHPGPVVTISWQGGEPTLMGIDFFQRAVALADSLRRPGQSVRHTLQTNGTLVDTAWAAFFAEHGFLVGVSVDGPADIHDRYRVDRGGHPTLDRVLRGIGHLVEHGVEWNALATVNAASEAQGREVYGFLRDHVGARYVQFIPVVERATAETLPVMQEGWGQQRSSGLLYRQAGALVTDRSVSPAGYGRFLIDVFEDWVRRDVGTVSVQMFEVALAHQLGVAPGLCVHAETCGDALALEHTGDVYRCDHYVEPDHLVGNLLEEPLDAIVASPGQRAFGEAKSDALPRACRECDVRSACHGGCPKDRFVRDRDGEPGLNHLCPSYRAFFGHVDRPMRLMAEELRSGGTAAGIINVYATEDARRGRNEPCPCGGGRKWKRCHGVSPTGSA